MQGSKVSSAFDAQDNFLGIGRMGSEVAVYEFEILDMRRGVAVEFAGVPEVGTLC
jgi:hypothetical protein